MSGAVRRRAGSSSSAEAIAASGTSPGSARSTAVRPARMAGWSSTMRTRITGGLLGGGGAGGAGGGGGGGAPQVRRGKLEGHDGAPAVGSRSDGQRGPDRLGAAPHGAQPGP